MSCLFQEETPEMKVLVCSQACFHVGNNISAPRQRSLQSRGSFVPKTEASAPPSGTRSRKPRASTRLLQSANLITRLRHEIHFGDRPLPNRLTGPCTLWLLVHATGSRGEAPSLATAQNTKEVECLRSERQPLTA